MNIKRILIGLGIASIIFATICSFCDSGFVGEYARTSFGSVNSSRQEFDAGTGLCFAKYTTNNMYYSLDGGTTQQSMTQYTYYCFTGTVYFKGTTQTIYYLLSLPLKTEPCPSCPTVDSNYCTSNNLCPSCPSCPSQFTSLECQTEYSLIPVSSVTENYCTSNFDLISPSDCPLSEGTGATQWSALRLNNVQYAGASNIYINISDLLDYSTTYIESGSSFVVDVDGYVADTGYLNDILTVQEYHPNSEDFTMSFVGALTLGLPYVMVALFVVFVRKLIKKIFKS